jgi:hypothetical protein
LIVKPGGEEGEVHRPKIKKQTELARVVEDDSDAKKPRETYVPSGKWVTGRPLFSRVWGNIRRQQKSRVRRYSEKYIPVSKFQTR